MKADGSFELDWGTALIDELFRTVPPDKLEPLPELSKQAQLHHI